MATKDTSQLKENILSVLQQRGPSLPVHIAKGTNLSILFASAFLSELLSERKIKISNMRVGNSPIYFIPGQENQLENFALHLNNKEKEAFTLLQNKKILKDGEQHPAIRVALRSIKEEGSKLVASLGVMEEDNFADLATIADQFIRKVGITFVIVWGITRDVVRISARSNDLSDPLDEVLREKFGDQAGAKLSPTGLGQGGAVIELGLDKFWITEQSEEDLEKIVDKKITSLILNQKPSEKKKSKRE